MAKLSCFSIALFFLLALLFSIEVSHVTAADASVEEYLPNGGEGSIRPEKCGPACDYRCSVKGHKKRCLFYCNTCCQRCLCIPSGTYGQNREECPCWNNKMTRQGTHKCP